MTRRSAMPRLLKLHILVGVAVVLFSEGIPNELYDDFGVVQNRESLLLHTGVTNETISYQLAWERPSATLFPGR
jgi:hypothetical protein